MDRIDLHTHSTASDGSMTPSELVHHAASCGLRAVALTDHDTTVGLTEAQQAANEIGIELVHGVELATWLDKTEFHIVGLDINENNPHFQTAMARMQQIREERNNQMVARMQAAGVDITLEKLHAKEGIGVLTRANFAGYLLSVGFVKSIKEAFDRYLGDGKPFYIPRTKTSPKEAIELIKQADGIPVLAHPMLYKLGKNTLEKYVKMMTDWDWKPWKSTTPPIPLPTTFISAIWLTIITSSIPAVQIFTVLINRISRLVPAKAVSSFLMIFLKS